MEQINEIIINLSKTLDEEKSNNIKLLKQNGYLKKIKDNLEIEYNHLKGENEELSNELKILKNTHADNEKHTAQDVQVKNEPILIDD